MLFRPGERIRME